VIGAGDVSLKGISLCGIIAIALNLLLPGGQGWRSKALSDEQA
ncbi:MAG: hypothetical protein WA161_06355, partial [Pseudomonas sp.]